nr:expressed protein [Hymenolepis microstoma]
MSSTLWIFLLLSSFFTLTRGDAAKNHGIEQLIQEFRKEPPPESIWMIHEAGNILDETWEPPPQDNGKFVPHVT